MSQTASPLASSRPASRLLLVLLALTLAHCVAGTPPSAGGDSEGGTSDPMLAYLLKQTEKRPDHADSWRLLARHYRQHERFADARSALERALSIDDHNLAALYEAGELALDEGKVGLADQHFLKLLRLGEESAYAEKLRAHHPTAAARLTGIVTLSHQAADDSEVAADLLPVSYEIQTFDGADDAEAEFLRRTEQAPPSLSRLRIFLETGVLYNSNVSLAPTSRELRDPASDAAGFQLFANPDVEWDAIRWGRWKAGPSMRGYGTVNESRLSNFDLWSFQPGAFVEKESSFWGSDLISRADYAYTIDLFDQKRFADRHAITLSLTAIRPSGNFLYGYWTSSFSQFRDDGINPSVDSLDGPSHATGLTQFVQLNKRWIQTINIGVDGEMAETEGADFRYDAINLHGGATSPLGRRLFLLPEAGVGYRSYADYTGTPSRNELTWRVGARLRWDWTDRTSVSLVARHDRFASENEMFDAERTEGGVVLTYIR